MSHQLSQERAVNILLSCMLYSSREQYQMHSTISLHQNMSKIGHLSPQIRRQIYSNECTYHNLPSSSIVAIEFLIPSVIVCMYTLCYKFAWLLWHYNHYFLSESILFASFTWFLVISTSNDGSTEFTYHQNDDQLKF